MIKNIQLVIWFLVLINSSSSNNLNYTSEWSLLRSQFESGFLRLDIPPLRLSYVQNIKAIQSKDSIRLQEIFFQSIDSAIKKIEFDFIPKEELLDFYIIKYETDLNLERINLEKKWSNINLDSISDDGLSSIPNGREWYIYLLKKWVDIEARADDIFEFGLLEIEKVKSRMKTLQKKSGLDSISFQKYIDDDTFFYDNIDDIQNEFEITKIRVAKNLNNSFPFLDKIPELNITIGTNKAFSKVPAYYLNHNNTFYYNYFDNPYNKRQISWIYIHEAIPGHHYQMSLDNILLRSSIQKLFEYYGYIEGYAAYIEELGYQIGAYQSIYDEIGKLEWDIIRSVRVAIDVGINYYNWNDEEALEFWQQHIKNKDDIALREIARMKRWPAQVITYKYGADKILKWKRIYQMDPDFNLKNFHQDILENGSLPLSILEKKLELDNRSK